MTETSRRPFIPLLAVVFLVAAIGSAGAPVFAQGASTISGAVRDSTGSLLPGATVAVTNTATGAERATAVTDAEGRYRLTALPGGRYEVRAVLSGFRTEVRNVELAADMVVDFTLGVELQEQIVVTALRRAERLQDVPATVDAFDAGMIEQAGITSMRDYVGMAPQISLIETQNIGFAFVNVRGLSQVRNSEPTVAVVVDGVLQTTGLGFSEELYDIEQVEVLKGPQGALYGRNASGGAINITTRQPTNKLEGFARAGFGNGENKGFIGSISGALVPNVLLGRAAVSFKDADGWRENITLGRKADSYADRSVRGQTAVATGSRGERRPEVLLFEHGGRSVPVRLECAQFRHASAGGRPAGRGREQRRQEQRHGAGAAGPASVDCHARRRSEQHHASRFRATFPASTSGRSRRSPERSTGRPRSARSPR